MKRVLFLTLILFSVTASFAQTIPWFSFKDLSGKTFTRDNLDLSKPVFIMFFDPYCEHCETQAKNIAQSASRFQNIQLVWVTIESDVKAVNTFRDTHFGRSGLTKLYFLQDTEYKFERYFGYTEDAVNIYLYKPGVAKLKYFGSEQTAAELLKYL